MRDLEGPTKSPLVPPAGPRGLGGQAQVRPEAQDAAEGREGDLHDRSNHKVPQRRRHPAALFHASGVGDYHRRVSIVPDLERATRVETSEDLEEVRGESILLEHRPEDGVVHRIETRDPVDVGGPRVQSMLQPLPDRGLLRVEGILVAAVRREAILRLRPMPGLDGLQARVHDPAEEGCE